MLCFTCHLSLFYCSLKIRQRGWANWWKVCYQRGLPSLVSIKMVEDACSFPGAGQNCPLPLLLPLMFRLRMIFSMVVLAEPGEVKKLFLCWGLPHTRFFCLLMLLLVLIFLPQPFKTYTLSLCCHILCFLGAGKDLKAMSQTLQGWTLSLSCASSPNTDSIQQQHEFPNKPGLNTCTSRCQQMSTSYKIVTGITRLWFSDVG